MHQKPQAIGGRQGPILLRVYELLIQILKNILICPNMDSSNPIRSQFCTCWAAVACAKLWPDLVLIFHVRAKGVFANFALWALCETFPRSHTNNGHKHKYGPQIHFLARKILYFVWLIFHWSMFLGVWLIISQHWFRWRPSTSQVTCHFLNQWWPNLLILIYVTRPHWVKILTVIVPL